jgi:hypothetical protein
MGGFSKASHWCGRDDLVGEMRLSRRFLGQLECIDPWCSGMSILNIQAQGSKCVEKKQKIPAV